MIAIVDSGSTKADWVFTDGKNRKTLSTPGMNPNILKEKQLKQILSDASFPFPSKAIDHVFFLGTGCSVKKQVLVVKKVLFSFFQNAKVYVDHDVMGAVIATCGNEKGISCILGTGSNSVYFDGKKIHKNNYGLGYVLSDEGAGTHLGKKIVTQYLYGLLPSSLNNLFKQKYNLTKEKVIINTYTKPAANAWLASFAGFVIEHKKHPWIKKEITKSLEEFIDLFVVNYKEAKKLPVHFVGSIAFYFQDILKDLLKKKGITMGKIVRKPIDELEKYYIENYIK